MTSVKQFDRLFEICEQVSKHPDLQKYLEVSEDPYDVIKWLPMDNILNGHVEASPDFIELMDALSLELNGKMIDNHGQCSNAFYSVRAFGYATEIGEADSFGPLTCVFTNVLKDWKVCYG